MDNTTRKEKIGVNYLEWVCLQSPFVESDINRNDKTPFIDGEIRVYRKDMPAKSRGYIKEYLDVSAPIQVKTTEVDSIAEKVIKFKVEDVDLKGFKDKGGVLFILVAFERNNIEKREIYYLNLTPLKIEYLLDKKRKKNKKKSKSKSQTTSKNRKGAKEQFFKLNCDIEDLVRNFAISCKRQSIRVSSSDKVYSLDSLDKFNSNFKEFKLSYSLLDNQVIDAEVYGVDKNSDIIIPFNYEVSEEIIKNFYITTQYDVTLNDTIYYSSKKTSSLTGVTNNFKLNLSDNLLLTVDSKSVQFMFKGTTDISGIIYDLKFLYDALLEGFFFVNKVKLNVKCDSSYLKSLKDKIGYFSLLFSIMKVTNSNYLVSKFSDIDAKFLSSVKNMYDKEMCNIEESVSETITVDDNYCVFVKYPIDNSNFDYIVKCKFNGLSYYYSFRDYLCSQMAISLDLEQNQKVSINNFMLLFNFFIHIQKIKSLFFELTDVDLSNILNSVKSVKELSIYEFEYYNSAILDAIKCVDECENECTKVNLLLFLKDLYFYISSICKFDVNSNIDYIMVNKYQIIKRIRDFEDSEVRELNLLYEKYKDEPGLNRLAPCILLSDWDRVKEYYNCLSKDDKDTLYDWPIFNLIPKDVLN